MLKEESSSFSIWPIGDKDGKINYDRDRRGNGDFSEDMMAQNGIKML